MELEREKQQIIWELDGRFAIQQAVKKLPVPAIVKMVDVLIGDDDEAYRAKQAELKLKLEELNKVVSDARERLRLAKERRADIVPALAHARRELAQAVAELRKCKSG